jgi:hypothetical protein
MKRNWVILLVACGAAAGTFAQFGGRPGDAVLYLVTSKGSAEFLEPAADGQAPPGFGHLEVIDPADLPFEPFGPDFPTQFRQLLHTGPDDLFYLVTQFEGREGAKRVFLATGKALILKGLLREFTPGRPEATIDFAGAGFTTFPRDVDIGPNLALDELEVLLWTNDPVFPIFERVDPDFVGPAVPPGMTGTEYVTELASAPLFVAWEKMRNLYPGRRWQDGIDLKVIDEDPAMGATFRLLRLRPGRATPSFQIDGNTHLFVLEGSVDIQPAGGSVVTVGHKRYAFLERTLPVRLSNPRKYEGPFP